VSERGALLATVFALATVKGFYATLTFAVTR